jgi:hypothetical protein
LRGSECNEWTTASIALTGKKGGGQTGGHSRIREIIGKLKVGRWRIGAGEKVDAGVVKARSSMAVIIIGRAATTGLGWRIRVTVQLGRGIRLEEGVQSSLRRNRAGMRGKKQ